MVDVEVGGATGCSVVVVVRRTVVVVDVGGGVDTTSSLLHALKQAAAPMIKSMQSEVFILLVNFAAGDYAGSTLLPERVISVDRCVNATQHVIRAAPWEWTTASRS
ncbi:MAG: hypothetical protein JOZ60_02295 [Verrucomicrobia bacterium]|nr:hypothetical protein [Verrucomicrobiota bacterium]